MNEMQLEPAKGPKLADIADVAKLMKEDSTTDRSCIWVLHLDRQNKLLEKELVAIGSLAVVVTSTREVFKKAIIHSAYSIVIVGNHPCGNPEPSPQELFLSTALWKAGMLLGIKVVDYLIITKDQVASMRELNQWSQTSKLVQKYGFPIATIGCMN